MTELTVNESIEMKDIHPSDEPDFFENLSGDAKDVMWHFGDQTNADIETVMDILDLERRDVRRVFKELVKVEYGKIKIGRRGRSTRFIFSSMIVDYVKTIKLTEKMISEGKVPSIIETEKASLPDSLNSASVEDLVNALKDNHGVTSVHLIY